MKVVVYCCGKKHIGHKKSKIRLVPGFGPVTEQKNPVPRPAPPKTIDPLPNPFEEMSLMASFTMTDTQQCEMTITAFDKVGNPTTLPPGSVTWLVDNVDLVTLEPSDDGMKCVVLAAGPLGSGMIAVKVVDGGVPVAAGSIGISIIAGAAVHIEITPATPTEQP